MPSPSIVSKSDKSTVFDFNKKKPLNRLPYEEMYWCRICRKQQRDVQELVSLKDAEIEDLKKYLSLLLLKSSTLEENIKSRDRKIEELVAMVRK